MVRMLSFLYTHAMVLYTLGTLTLIVRLVYHRRSMYECVDKNPESVPGLNSGSDPRALFYPVEAKCNGLSCPPYNAEKELTCAVCTR